jgi:hypothetical protein
MFLFRLYAATGDAVAQLDSLNGETVDVSLNLEGRGVMCNTFQPHLPVPITNAATAPARSPFTRRSW